MSADQTYTAEQIRVILTDIIKSIAEPDHFLKLNDAKEAAGNEMLKMMQIIFPMVVQMEMDVIKKFGFASGREGMVHFTQIVRDLERSDPEIARLHNEIRSHFLPPVSHMTAFDT